MPRAGAQWAQDITGVARMPGWSELGERNAGRACNNPLCEVAAGHFPRSACQDAAGSMPAVACLVVLRAAPCFDGRGVGTA